MEKTSELPTPYEIWRDNPFETSSLGELVDKQPGLRSVILDILAGKKPVTSMPREWRPQIVDYIQRAPLPKGLQAGNQQQLDKVFSSKAPAVPIRHVFVSPIDGHILAVGSREYKTLLENYRLPAGTSANRVTICIGAKQSHLVYGIAIPTNDPKQPNTGLYFLTRTIAESNRVVALQKGNQAIDPLSPPNPISQRPLTSDSLTILDHLNMEHLE